MASSVMIVQSTLSALPPQKNVQSLHTFSDKKPEVYGKVTELYRNLSAIEETDISNILFEAAKRSTLLSLLCYTLFLPITFLLIMT